MPPPGPPEGLPSQQSNSQEESEPTEISPEPEDVVEEPPAEEVTEEPEVGNLEASNEEPAAVEESSEQPPVEEESVEPQDVEQPATESSTEEPTEAPAEVPVQEEEAAENTPEQEPVNDAPKPVVSNRAKAAEKEVIKLSNEVHSLRKSLAGAADVIEDLETQPMPPAVLASDIVVPDHLVADIARLARQLDREQLVRANMGTISMLHPGMPGVMISTKAGTTLSRLNERGIVGGRLGQGSPQNAPSDWRVLEVLLAATSLETGGPAACIHMMGAYTTTASCEKDLILCSPIDEVGKKMLGKIVIVDTDDENPDDFLRQTAEALKMGGSKCVVIRGHGAYCVGADLDDAWANAAMLEHSMKIVLLARQANLKV
jgi:ribulose-5-phosphate 4-epimerase/fuculose-1-phosphate aldolase